MTVKEINKITLGKMQLSYIGNEGVKDKAGLRHLLQACIDFLQTEAAGFWKDASITIYDEDEKMYKIVSGSKNQFICRMKNGEPFIKDKYGISEPKKPRSYRASTDTSHNPSQKGYNYSCLIS